ncbi:hypothetical protein B0H11DRAFT_1953119 [Mycena galericulata]|nr:hypothetical protein B0H11DRAFT_1953119 [Mycena galericulata]
MTRAFAASRATKASFISILQPTLFYKPAFQMARFAALFFAAVAAATSVGAASHRALANRAVIPAVAGPTVPLITFYTDVNYAGESVTFEAEKTTGCIGATGAYISSVSSIKLQQSGIACNLWSEANCGGVAGLVAAADVPNLITYGFNDKMVSYNCYSTA